MKDFLERHLGAFRATTLFDASSLTAEVRRSVILVVAIVSPVIGVADVAVWAFLRLDGLLPWAVFSAVLSVSAWIQLRIRRHSLFWTFLVASVGVAAASVVGDVVPVAGVVAGVAVAASGTLTLVEGRWKGLRQILATSLFLGAALFFDHPVAQTWIGVAVMVIAQLLVWWMIGAFSLQSRMMSERFRSLVRESPDGVLITDSSGLVMFANPRVVELFGGDPTDHALDSVLPTVPGPVREELRVDVEQRDGNAFPASIRRSAIEVDDERFDVFVVTDLTEEVAARRRIEASEDRYRRLFARVPVGLYTTESDGRIVQGNDALAHMLGFSRAGDLVGTNNGVLHLDLDARRRHTDEISEWGSATAEYRLRTKMGNVIWVRDHCSSEADSDGSTRYHGELTDITEERAAREGLEAALASRERLIAAVSHELRTPLTAVLGLVRLLKSGEISGDEVDDTLTLVLSQSEELASIVEDLLAATRLSQDELEVVRRPVDVAETTRGVIEVVDLSGRTVALDFDAEAVAMADPLRVRQVVRNLLTNVGKYGGPNVRVSVAARNGSVSLSVADDGDGLGRGEEHLAFEPFHRLEGARKDHGSLGLGLHLARGLAQAMDGSLTYAHDGEWATFTLALPRETPSRT